jgi:hypothetical protein
VGSQDVIFDREIDLLIYSISVRQEPQPRSHTTRVSVGLTESVTMYVIVNVKHRAIVIDIQE